MKATKAALPTPRVAALKTFLDDKPGTESSNIRPNVVIYKVTGKMFAILSVKTAYVVLKCAPDSIPMLKAKYAGVGHKTHLDPRHWIAVEIDADVPPGEVRRLAGLSYDLARSAGAPKAKSAKKAKKAV